MIKKKHTNNDKKQFCFFFVSSLAALSEADAAYQRAVMPTDGPLWAVNGPTSNTLKSMGETNSGCNKTH